MKSKKPTTLLKILSIATILVAGHESSFAFGGPPGGPFSNGSYFPNDGTFSAVVRGRGQNLTGILQFSTTSGSGPAASSSTSTSSVDFGFGISSSQSQSSSSTGGVGSTGVSTIFYNGDTFQGNSQGAYNASANGMTVSFQADAAGQGEKTIKVQTAVTVDVPVIVTQNGTTTLIETQETQFVPTKEIYYFDSLFINGAAECSTSNAFPNQKFQGSGDAEFQHLVFTGDTPFLDAVPIPITVSGVRLSNESSSFNTSDVRPPSVNQFSVLIQ